MGAFDILKRFRSSESAKATAPSAETLTADKAATGINVAARTSQKKSKRLNKTAGAAGIAGALAGASSAQDGVAPASNKLSEVAPRVDLSILREPSPPLVDVSFDGHRASSPWVDLAAYVEPPRRGSLGFGFGASSSPTSRAVNEKLQDYLNEKRITPKQATVLVRECTKVLQGQGLETLGIFRPWRLAESPYIIARTLALFLKAVCPSDNVPLEERDFLGFGRDQDALTAFTDSLEDAGTHNVVASLKWGLRHLHDSPSGDADRLCSDPWDLYRLFLHNESEKDYDGSAYNKVILHKLPREHGHLLAVCLSLFAAVATHDTQNAMPGLHLCRLLAFWLFGRHRETFLTWTSLYNDYLVAAGCLEHLFLAYLRQEKDLPLRLQDLVTLFPPERLRLAEAVQSARLLKAEDLPSLHATLATSSAETITGPSLPRRMPGALLASALQASFEETATVPEDTKASWERLIEQTADNEGEGIDLQRVIVDETERIFDIVAERAEKGPRVRIAGDRRASTYGNRRRSMSIDVGMMQSTSSKSSDSTGRNRTLSNDARMQSSPSHPIDFSWGDFETKGFTDDFDSDGFSLFSEVGRPSMDEEGVPQRPSKLKKPYPYASLASRHLEFGRRYGPGQINEHDVSLVTSEIKDLRATKVDPVFIEMYLDSLEDPSITAHWPVFVVAELKDAGALYKAVIAEMTQPDPIKFASSSTVAIPRTLESPSDQTQVSNRPGKRLKTGFFSLGSRKKQASSIVKDSKTNITHSLPRGTSGEPGLGINELGQWRANEPYSRPSPMSAEDLQRQASASSLPNQARRQSVPTIVKTSPLTPPRRHKSLIKSAPRPEPIPEDVSEHRSTPSPTQSSGSLGKKVSRKPVPVIEDEDVVLAEVSQEAETAPEIKGEKEENAASSLPNNGPRQSVAGEGASISGEIQTPNDLLSAGEAVSASPEPSTEDDSSAHHRDQSQDNTLPVRLDGDSLEMASEECAKLMDEDAPKELPTSAAQEEAAPANSHLSIDDQPIDTEAAITTPEGVVEATGAGDTISSRPATPARVDLPTVVIEDTDLTSTTDFVAAENDPAAEEVATTSNQDTVRDTSTEQHTTLTETSPSFECDKLPTADPQEISIPQGRAVALAGKEADPERHEVVEKDEGETVAVGSDESVNAPASGQENETREEPMMEDALVVHSSQKKENLQEATAQAKPTKLKQVDVPVFPSRADASSVNAPLQDQITGDDLEEAQQTTPKRFGSTLNRVSPTLKERFGLDSKSQRAAAERDNPKDKAQAPPSPSRRAALLSGAKKMLTRKKSSPFEALSPSNAEAAAPAAPVSMIAPFPRDARVNALSTSPTNTSSAPAEQSASAGAMALSPKSSTEVANEKPDVAADPLNLHTVPLRERYDQFHTSEDEPVRMVAPSSGRSSHGAAAENSADSTVAAKPVPDEEITDLVSAAVEGQGDSPENEKSITGNDGTDADSAENAPAMAGEPHRINIDARDAAPVDCAAPPSEDAPDVQVEDIHETTKETAQSEYEAAVIDESDEQPESQHVENTSVLSPLSAVLATAQDAVASTAVSIGTMAAAVLPSSLTGPAMEDRPDHSVEPPVFKENISDERTEATGEVTDGHLEPREGAVAIPLQEEENPTHMPSTSRERSTASQPQQNTASTQHIADLDTNTANNPIKDNTPDSADTQHHTSFVVADRAAKVGMGAIPAEDATDESSTAVEEAVPARVDATPSEASEDLAATAGELGQPERSSDVAEREHQAGEDVVENLELGVQMDRTDNLVQKDQLHESKAAPVIHLASPSQLDTSASITTSPVSGLPIRTADEPTSEEAGEGHMAFNKAGAEPSMHDIQPTHTDVSAESRATSASDVSASDEVKTARSMAGSEDQPLTFHTTVGENSDESNATADKLPGQSSETLQHGQGSGPFRNDEPFQVTSQEDDGIKVDIRPAEPEESHLLEETSLQPSTDRSEGGLEQPSSQNQLPDQTSATGEKATEEDAADNATRSEGPSSVFAPAHPVNLRSASAAHESSLDKPSETENVHDKLLAEIEARKEKLHIGAEADLTDSQHPEQAVQQEDPGAV